MKDKTSRKRKTSDLPFEAEMMKPNLKESKIEEETLNFLPSLQYKAQECGGEGNCLFLSIYYLLGSPKKSSHLKLRKAACDYIQKHIEDFAGALEYEKDPQEYLKEMRKPGIWGGHPEIKALAIILKRNILIYEYKYSKSKKCSGFCLKSTVRSTVSKGAPLLLRHIPETHYQAIVPTERIKIELNKEPTINKIKTQDRPSLNTHNATPYRFDPQVVAKKEAYQLYPKKNQGSDFYNDVHKYFESGKTYEPPALKGKGEKFWRKRSKWKPSCEKNYAYDSKLMRILQKEEVGHQYLPTNSPSALVQKNENLFLSLYYIPLEIEKKSIMEFAHNQFSHNSRDRMLISIRRMGYTWWNMTKDIKQFLQECLTCKFKNLKKEKTQPTLTQIIALHPGHIYQIDMVQLAKDYQTNDEKYLIVIADHFSKFGWCKSCSSKESKSIVEAIQIFFSFCGKPKILQSDNGREFVNKEVESFLQKQDVKFLHGRPYHPQSQGMIERLNRTIQQSLNVIFAKNPSNFKINDAISDIMMNYNANYHTTIKMSPREAFNLSINNEKNLKQIEKIRNNIKKAFSNKITVNNFQIGQKAVLHNCISKKGQNLVTTTIKKKIGFQKGFYIPITITKVYQSKVEIQINKRSLIVGSELSEGTFFKVGLGIIKAISEREWMLLIDKLK